MKLTTVRSAIFGVSSCVAIALTGCGQGNGLAPKVGPMDFSSQHLQVQAPPGPVVPSSQPAPRPVWYSTSGGATYAGDQVLLRAQPGASSGDVQNLASSYGGSIIYQFPSGWYLLGVPATMSAPDVVSRLNGNALVAQAQLRPLVNGAAATP